MMPTDDFMQSLQRDLEKGAPLENPFREPEKPQDHPVAPPEFSRADAILHPRLYQRMAEERAERLNRVANQPGQSQRFEYQYDCFVVHQPPWVCGKCREAAEQAHDQAKPGDVEGDEAPGQVSCPHTRRRAYVELMNKSLRREVTIASHKESQLQNGCIQVSVAWGVPISVPSAKKTDPPRTPVI